MKKDLEEDMYFEKGMLKRMDEQAFSERESYLNRAREGAKLTIPNLIRD